VCTNHQNNNRLIFCTVFLYCVNCTQRIFYFYCNSERKNRGYTKLFQCVQYWARSDGRSYNDTEFYVYDSLVVIHATRWKGKVAARNSLCVLCVLPMSYVPMSYCIHCYCTYYFSIPNYVFYTEISKHYYPLLLYSRLFYTMKNWAWIINFYDYRYRQV